MLKQPIDYDTAISRLDTLSTAQESILQLLIPSNTFEFVEREGLCHLLDIINQSDSESKESFLSAVVDLMIPSKDLYTVNRDCLSHLCCNIKDEMDKQQKLIDTLYDQPGVREIIFNKNKKPLPNTVKANC